MAGGFRFLSLVQPFMSVLPEVAQAERKIPFRYALPSFSWRAASLRQFCAGGRRAPARARSPGRGPRGIGWSGHLQQG